MRNIIELINKSRLRTSDLKYLLNISNMDVLKWKSGKINLNEYNIILINRLCYILERFEAQGIIRKDHLLKMKLFDRESILNLLKQNKVIKDDQIDSLIREYTIIEENYKNFKISKSKPTNDWKCYISIPG